MISESTHFIPHYETDQQGCLQPFYLCNYFQEQADKQANDMGFGIDDLQDQGCIWALTRMSIQVNSWPLAGHSIGLKTWVQSVGKIISDRSYCLLRNDAVLIRATSRWACLSGNDHKPVPIPGPIGKKMRPIQDPEYVFSLAKLPPCKGSLMDTLSLKVSYDEIDRQNHVNNAHYVRWSLNPLTSSIREQKELVSLDMNFLNESFEEDELTMVIRESGDHSYDHEILNPSNEKVIFRMRSRWKVK